MVAPPPGGGGLPPNVTPFPGAMPPSNVVPFPGAMPPPNMPPPPPPGVPGMPVQPVPMGQPLAPPSPDTVLGAITAGVAGASDEELKELLSDMTRQEMQGLVNALAVMDPEDAERVKALWQDLLDPGPKYPKDYPRWFKRPKRPNQAVVESRVGQDEGEYGAYRDRVQRTLEWLTFQRRGDWKKKDKNDEPWQSPALVADHNARSFLVGGITPQYRKRPLTGAVEADAQKCEDFLSWTRRQHERQHADAFNGPLGIDEARYLDTHGMLVTKVMLDPENEEFPFILEVMDPTTCFAVPGGRHGLQRLTRRYTTTVGKALDAFDTDGTLATKLFKPRQNAQGNDITRSLTSEVTVVEYYDRWWMMVVVDGIKAIDAAHRYGWVPFIVTPGGWGLPLSMADPLASGSRISDGTVAQSTSTWYNRVVGPLHYQLIPHAQLEAIMSKYATAVRKANNPAFIRARSLMANNKPAAPVTTNDGEQNVIQKDEEELTPLNLGPAPQMAQPLIADLTRSFGMTMLPMQQYGAEAGANATGNAIEQLTENGRVILTGHIKAAERHHAAVGMRLLCLMRDWGDILGEEGKRGVLHIPYRADRVNKEDYSFEMTPEVVKRAGVEVEAVMTNVALSGLLQLGNAVAIWLNNKVMSRREAIELRGNYDPQGVFDQINEEDALLDPRVRDLSILKSLYDRAGVSQHLPPAWLASKWEQLVAQPPSGPGGPGGPRPPGGGGNPNTSATNMAALGQGPGSAGNVVGRPPGGAPPPGMPLPPGPPTEPQPPPPGLG